MKAANVQSTASALTGGVTVAAVVDDGGAALLLFVTADPSFGGCGFDDFNNAINLFGNVGVFGRSAVNDGDTAPVDVSWKKEK
jgi:hypothetical protein